jgi:hypothetical protein
MCATAISFARLRRPYFGAHEPKMGGVDPTLVRDDGSVLTEFPAIATWLARTKPEKSLLPSNAEAEAQVIEAMDYVVSTMYMQGFSRVFRPVNYAPSETDHERVKARGMPPVDPEAFHQTVTGVRHRGACNYRRGRCRLRHRAVRLRHV